MAGVLDELPALTAIRLSGGWRATLRLHPSHWAGRLPGLGGRGARGVGPVDSRPRGHRGSVGEHGGQVLRPLCEPVSRRRGLLAAGLAGIEAGASLPEPIVAIPPDRRSHGRLPESVDAAVDALVASALGEPRLDAFVALRRAEGGAAARGRRRGGRRADSVGVLSGSATRRATYRDLRASRRRATTSSSPPMASSTTAVAIPGSIMSEPVRASLGSAPRLGTTGATTAAQCA